VGDDEQVVEKSDYLIDLHGGDLDESLRPYSYWAPTGNAQQDAVSRAMVLAFGLDTIILSTDRPRDPNSARYLETNASLRGKPSLTAEAGHAGTVEPEEVTALINGCLNVMRYLKMLPRAMRLRCRTQCGSSALPASPAKPPAFFIPRSSAPGTCNKA
jgi:uncharacterized protein